MRNQIPSARAHRLRAAILVGCVVSALALGATACNVSWKVGKTHGAIVETTAARASVGVWRAPTRVLHTILAAKGIDTVQTILCAAGKFPPLTVSVGKSKVSADVLKSRWCGYVHGDDADLQGALRAAQDGRDDCLALTLISRGAYIKNWTHKSSGCRTGSL